MLFSRDLVHYSRMILFQLKNITKAEVKTFMKAMIHFLTNLLKMQNGISDSEKQVLFLKIS